MVTAFQRERGFKLRFPQSDAASDGVEVLWFKTSHPQPCFILCQLLFCESFARLDEYSASRRRSS